MATPKEKSAKISTEGLDYRACIVYRRQSDGMIMATCQDSELGDRATIELWLQEQLGLDVPGSILFFDNNLDNDN